MWNQHLKNVSGVINCDQTLTGYKVQSHTVTCDWICMKEQVQQGTTQRKGKYILVWVRVLANKCVWESVSVSEHTLSLLNLSLKVTQGRNEGGNGCETTSGFRSFSSRFYS